MIVDPVQALATGTIPIATTTATALPTVTSGPRIVLQEATETGDRTLWVVFVVMVVAMIVFTGMAWSVPMSKRLYHIVTTMIVTFAAISYFGMATKHGIGYHTIKKVEQHEHTDDTYYYIKREVYWARYVDWSVTTPLLLLDLLLLAGASGGAILIAIVADVIMIITGLFAAFGTENTPQKWGWYAIACIAYLGVLWQLIINGRSTAAAKSSKVANFYAAIGGFTVVIWTVYPIIWGIADGSRNMDVNAEILSYAVLDILAKPVFGAWLLFTHMSMPETNVDIGGFWAHGLGSEGQIRVGDDDEGA